MAALRLRKREKEMGWLGSMLILLISIAVAFALSGALMSLQGVDPVAGLKYLLEGGFLGPYALEDSLLKAIPLFLCSLGVSIAFRMQIWNIGAEGQYALGAVGATGAMLLFPNLPMVLLLPLTMFSAMLTGGLWGFVPGYLRLRFGLNEIISTLMLNYVGIEFLRFLVFGPWKSPTSMGFPMSSSFPEAAVFPALSGRIHSGLLVCIVVAIVLALFLQRTRLGFELRSAGENPKAARYARMSYNKLLALVMTMSGALAGLAGCIEVSTTFNALQPNFCTGYGYTAIVVAWLSRLKISAIALFAFFLAGLRVGGENLQIEVQLPAAFSGILEGLILLCVLAGQLFYTYQLEWQKPEQSKTAVEA